MKKRIFFITVALLLALLGGAVLWLTYTAAGLQFAITQLNRVPGIKVTLTGVGGRLAGPLHIDYFELDHVRVHVIARNIDADLKPALLMSGGVAIGILHIDDIEVTLKPGEPGPDTGPPHFLPGFLRVSVDSLQVERGRFNNYNGFSLTGAPLRARVSLTRSALRLTELDVQTDWLAVAGRFELRSRTALELAADVAATLKPGQGTPLQGKVNMSGNTSLLNFAVDIQQPQTARVTAALDLAKGWQLNGTLVAQHWELSPWMDDAPFSFSDAQLQFAMNDAGIRLNGDLAVPEWMTPLLHLDVQGQYAARVITLQHANISAKNGAIATHTTGSIALNDQGPPTLDLHGSWRGLQWPLAADTSSAYFRSTSGAANLRGASPYRFDTDAELSVPIVARNMPITSAITNSSRIVAAGVLTPQVIVIERYDWQVLQGRATGSGELQFALPRAWRMAILAQNLNTGLIHAQSPGRVHLDASVTGQNFGARSPFDLQLQRLSGSVRNQPLRASGHVAHAGQTWQADNVNVNFGSATLRASGTLGPQNNLNWNLNAPQLHQLHNDLSGEVAMSGQVIGASDRPLLNLTVQSKHAGFMDWQLDALMLDARVDLTDREASQLSLRAERIGNDDYALLQPQLTGNGRASAHELKFTTKATLPQLDGSWQFSLAAAGAYADTQWQGTLQQWQLLDADGQQRVHLVQDAQLLLSNMQVSLQAFCLNADGGKLCADGEWRQDAAWQLRATLDNLPINLSNTAWAKNARLRSVVNARADFHGSNVAPWTGNASLTLNDAAIRYQVISGKEQVLPINVGEIRFDAAPTALNATARLSIGSDTEASMKATADRNGNDWHGWPLTGGAELSSAGAKLIPVFVSEVDRAAGTLTSHLRLAGTLGNPALSGTVQLRQGELDLYRTNLALRSLQFDADIADEQVRFTAQGNAGEGTLKSNGQFNWRGEELYGNLQLKGDRLLVADLPEYRVLASPDLNFEIAKHNVDVKGTILIPSAKLQPKDISGAVQTSADARFKSDKVFERGSAWTISSSITVKLGDDVQFDGLGLQGKLGGSVTTNLRTANTATGSGELNVNNGVYEAYGRKLDIKRGRLLFDNTTLDNPGLDIQAERKINDIIVGIYVRGVLRDPRLQFYSDPTMSQSQIVSYLIVGKPLDELQSGEATTVRSASSSLALQGGGYIAAQLGRRVGLEEVGVQSDANNQQSFVLGKFLSPRLFVSYGISLTEAINTLKLRYTLSDHWVLKTEAGEAKSADIEFRIDR